MKPFSGLRILDTTHVVAGPYATYQLAMLGAEVIKIEAPGDPDQTRLQGGPLALRKSGMGAWFISQGSNKKCMQLDLKSQLGKEVFTRLIETSDVLVENYRPGAFADLGFDYEAASRINPKLIYCSISAFGQKGPRSSQTGYDMVIQASSGLMAMTGTKECNPIKVGAPVVDYATGMSAAFAIASALFQRERTGKGQHIDLAMFDVGLTLMALFITAFDSDGIAHGPSGNAGPSPTSSCYATKDGLLMIAASNHRQQKRLWTALGVPEMIKSADELFTADRASEPDVLARVFRSRTAAEWEDFLQQNHVPAARVRTMTESLSDDQLAYRKVFGTIDCEAVARPFRVPIAPFLFEHSGPGLENGPQKSGADTRSILVSLGYTNNEIEAMEAEGSI